MSRVFRLLAVLSLVAVAGSAAAQRWQFELPEGARAFNFGNLVIRPFENVMSRTQFSDERGFGWTDVEGLSVAGGQWPDPLTGTYVGSLAGKPITFRAKVANGEYRVWLAAGPIIRPDLKERRFQLRLNDAVLFDDTPTDEQLAGEKYLFRFLRTQYSERPDVMWERYIARMYPSRELTLAVTDGEVRLIAQNHFLSALVLVPKAKEADFAALVKSIKEKRVAAYAKSTPAPPRADAAKPEDAGDYLLYVPEPGAVITPATMPSDDERRRTAMDAAGAPGSHVLLKLVVVPFAALGQCTLELADLEGPGVVRASAIEGYYRNYRYGRKAVTEMSLVPGLSIDVEPNVTQSFWLWMTVPDDARPGVYRGDFTFRTERGGSRKVPVTFEVYPFRLAKDVPVAYGFWGTGWTPPFLPKEVKLKVLGERFAWLRALGFTSVNVNGPSIRRLNADGTVEIVFDRAQYELAKEAGLAARPEQALLDGGLMASVGRQIGRRLRGVPNLDSNPGAELRHPDFRKYFLDAAKKYHAFIESTGLPVVVTSVDEPRERRINSWNRNYDDTLAYCDMMREVGLVTCVNPMRDVDHYVRKSYLGFIDHVDVLSTHAWEQSKEFMRQTLEKKKTLWLYNCGKDRYSWGFYNWRMGSNGRWEWHFCWARQSAEGGYPGREWYNPFTGLHGLNPAAPYATFRGGVLPQSAMLDMADGITDYAYVYTLTEALGRPQVGAKAQVAAEARAFLDALKKAMPEFPKVKGLAPGADGSAVGMGIDDEARLHVDDWRRRIAAYLKELAK
jgi:hypothetical protein